MLGFNKISIRIIVLLTGVLSFIFYPNEVFSQDKLYTLFFMGDTEAGQSNISFEAISSFKETNNTQGVILLGDHVDGLTQRQNKENEDLKNLLRHRFNTMADIGDLYIVPGEKDWDGGSKNGWTRVKNLQGLVDSLNRSTIRFLPDQGCPGPIEISLNDEITLVFMDLQWVLHPWDKPGKEEGCFITTVSEMAFLLEDILKRNRNKRVIVANHHPIFSYGKHEKALLPSYQYLNSPTRYKPMTQVLHNIYKKYPNTIVLSSHDQSLQYIDRRKTHHIISGSAVESTPVRPGQAEFVSEEIGFGMLDFYKDGRVVLKFIKSSDRSVLFEKEIFTKPYMPIVEPDHSGISFVGQTVITNVSDRYDKKSTWLGGQVYRNVWKMEREFPVFDIGTEKGGLEILRRGGGLQTKSLRLQNSEGREYVLRSVEKYPIKALPDILKTTIAADIIQDGISASHPYAAYVVPPLADAAQVYHANPKVVFIPDDPRFGEYRADFANTICLFEERLSGDWREYDHFGNSKKLISSLKMLDKLYEDNDNQVDQQWFVKSRLFDMFLGDWDRHEDQWRWAQYKNKDGDRLYRPIPRDRDQVFFINEGLIMNIAGRKWAQSRFQGFDYELSYIPGFNFNGRYVDREFLNELPLSAWQSTADSLQTRLTDEVIEDAFNVWPEQIFNERGEEIIAKLKSGRGNLKKYATEHYLFLSEEVNVVGSNKRELFEVERLNNQETDVTVRKISKKGKTDKVLYYRKFFTDETKEVRLYGLAGEDQFSVKGDVSKGIKVRIIGGEDADEIVDESSVSGWGKKTKIYDTENENMLTKSKETKDLRSKDPEINTYNRKEFRYNKLMPLVLLNYNVDDGVFLGGGFINTQHGFRKEPYKVQHSLSGSLAFATGSFQFEYSGDFIDVLGKWDINFDVKAFGPNFITNFFGIGNETEFNQNADEDFNVERAIDYYRTRFQQYTTQTLFKRDLGSRTTISIGSHTQFFDVEAGYDGEDRFVLDYADSLGDDEFFEWKVYQGLVLKFEYDSRNSVVFPQNGLHIDLDLRGYKGLFGAAEDFTRFMGSVGYYKTVKLPAKVTIAAVLGAGHNFGDYEFYQAQILSGNNHLRGFRKTRFFGDTKLYNNIELRTKLFTFKNRVVPTTIGLTLFNDIGRVWVDGEDSNKWHHGFGGGLWFSPINVFTLAFDVAYSEEEVLPYFKFGFRF